MSSIIPVAIGTVRGDLSGNLPSPIVTAIQNQPIDPRTPNNGYTLVYNGGEWIPTPAPTNTATIFKGLWDASTNNPDIANYPELSDGYIWLVNVAGNTNLGGITDWKIGDYAIYSNGQWYQLSNTSFGWGLTGNSGTIPTVNYVGTTDSHDLSIRANAQEIIKVLVGGGVNITGNLNIDGNTILNNNKKLVIKDINGYCSSFQGGNQSANINYKLPNSAGVFGANLVTDGSNNLSWKSPISILAGSGLTGGGDITQTRTISMPDVGVPATYGSASQIPVFTTDSQGRVSSVTNTSVSINGSQITSGVVSVSNGGTGLSSAPTNGQLLIGNGTGFTESTLTEGSGVSITNGSGTITVDNTGVLTVGATAPIASSGGQSPTISINDSGVSANTYGSASSVGVFTVNSKGLITSASNSSISISGSQITSGIVSVSNGGTGLSSTPTNGQLLIGNGTGFTESTLTAGSGVSVANGSGTITVGNTGVLTVGATAPIASSGGQSPTISINDSGVSANTYGSASSVGVFTVNSKGLITSASNSSIAIDTSQITSGTLPIVRGGTGLSSSGASGNILVSNGTSLVSVPMSGDATITSGGVVSVNSVKGMAFTATPTPAENYTLIYTGGQWTPTSAATAFSNSFQTVVASENIAAGDVCYIVNSGGSGNNPTVARAQANSITTVHGVIGLATTAIAKNATGVVQTYGQLIGPVDTHTFGQGDPLYVSATVPGGVTNVKPKGPNYTFQIGIVTRQGQPQNVTTGVVFVSPIMQTDTENLSDFVITSPIDHDSLMYDPVTLTWKNVQPLWLPETQTALTLAAGATITAANFANVVYLPIKTAGGANITLSATTPIANLTKTNADYGRELWLYNSDNNRNITIPAGATVKLDGGVNLVLTPGTLAKFLWTGLGGSGFWLQSSKAITLA